MSDTITITGNVATVPEFKRSGAGLPIATFRVASSQRKYDRGTGTWMETGTNWFQVSAFRGLAEHAFESLRKGDRVIVSGRLRVRQWDNGTKQGTSVDIEADAVGHDLLWGTSVFTKTGGAQPASWPTDGDRVESDGVESTANPAAEWHVAAAPDDARELALATADTPF
ncbi:single-stranded DNA-binding protein [Microbacterium aoyamense]|uniref:Single-stranded DNA-binding protein n=1 Tax=Microbacterium aoyamense TaxID=344166 RepID=A0ABN2P6C7_9MICO|nr:single-stranded DNA-binding protein [Microbacterium aoyamense]